MKAHLLICLLLSVSLLAGCTPLATPAAPTAVVETDAPANAPRGPATPGRPATGVAAPATGAPTESATAAMTAPTQQLTAPVVPPTASATAPRPAPTATFRRPASTPTVRPTVAPPTAVPATAIPTATIVRPSPAPAATVEPTSYRVTEITLPTYPYAAYIRPAGENGPVEYPVQVLDRGAYEASGPRPVARKYRALVLENKYLRLVILPDLGGRIYECTFKPTGNNEFYSNPVVKPTQWGPSSPAGANWWLGTGGLEWGFPVEEHGYEFGTQWGFDHAERPDGGMMISLYTKNGWEMPYAVVDVVLPPNTAYFVVQPRIVNPLGSAFRFKWWANAMVAPGAPNSATPNLGFVLPAQEVTVHSTGDGSLPGPGQAMSWPNHNGRDFSRLGNWTDYLGVFQRPSASGNFMGVYDPGLDEGLVRVYPSSIARGAKLFAPVRIDPQIWTDDASTYVEMHGGLEPTFDSWYELGPGQEVSWAEFWYPVARIGGVTWAGEGGALFVTPAVGAFRVALFPTSAVRGELRVESAGAPAVVRRVDIAPDRPFAEDLPLAGAAGQLRITLTDEAGVVVFEYAGQGR